MASRLIHLALAVLIEKEMPISDPRRFRAGSLIADANMDSVLRKGPHFMRYLPDDGRYYGLKQFLSLYGDMVKTDDLYLGYYLHLIQDAEYRKYMYSYRGWNSVTPGNVEKLHTDYRKINGYLTEKYALSPAPLFPSELNEEDICRQFDFNLDAFDRAFREDFKLKAEGDFFFFTPEYADEYIQTALAVCLRELEAIKAGAPLYDEESNSWGGKNGD